MPRFSIITVTYNAAHCLATSIDSLAKQRLSDYEWVIVDGASDDSTLSLVERSGIEPRRCLCEPDRGIYDAMNKAVRMATGEWLYFLNAGDAFADADVLGDVAVALQRSPATRLLYGDMLYARGDHVAHMPFSHVRRSLLVFEDLNHQAVFAHHSLFDEVGLFNIAFRTAADYDWLLRVFHRNTPVLYLPRTIARFDTGGAHAQNPQRTHAERQRVRLQFSGPRKLWWGLQLARLRRRWRLMRVTQETAG